jgi:hypothetical protein
MIFFIGFPVVVTDKFSNEYTIKNNRIYNWFPHGIILTLSSHQSWWHKKEKDKKPQSGKKQGRERKSG